MANFVGMAEAALLSLTTGNNKGVTNGNQTSGNSGEHKILEVAKLGRNSRKKRPESYLWKT